MRKTIMIVDTLPKMKNILAHYLEKTYHIVYKMSATDAAAYLDKGGKADVIIADIGVPDVTSADFLEYAQKKQGNRMPPVMIFCSAGEFGKDLRYFKYGSQDHTMKPIHLEELKKKIDHLMGINGEIDLYIEKLETSNRELRQFALVASHDLREPLRMVSTYVRLLRDDLGTEATELQENFIKLAIGGVERMEDMVLDLLSLATADRHPQTQNIVLEEVMAAVKNNLDVLITERNAVVRSFELGTLRGDRTMVTQLLQNLVANGIKYNESKQPVVHVSYADSGNEIEIQVADNGIGIPEEFRDKVFQVFQRVPGEGPRTGTGIGLAICKKIMDRMGGRIVITDQPGGGTIFSLCFPQSGPSGDAEPLFWHPAISSIGIIPLDWAGINQRLLN